MIYERYIKELPLSVKAIIRTTRDGDYIIYFNPAYSQEELQKAAKHELEHIAHHDLENRDMKDVSWIEKTRH